MTFTYETIEAARADTTGWIERAADRPLPYPWEHPVVWSERPMVGSAPLTSRPAARGTTMTFAVGTFLGAALVYVVESVVRSSRN